MKSVLTFAIFTMLIACTGTSTNKASYAMSEVSFRGSTQLRLGRLNVTIPFTAMPSEITGCILEANESGRSGEFGISLNDTVWDVKIFCDEEEIRELFDSIRICIEPVDGRVQGKLVYQEEREGFSSLPLANAMEGTVCGLAEHLSLFTLGPSN